MTLTLRRPSSLVPALAVLAFGVLLIDAVIVTVVLSHTLHGEVLGDWLSFYTAGVLVRTGHAAQLYDASLQAATQQHLFGANVKTMGYPLPVFAAVLFAPLSRLSFTASYLAWLAINLAALGVLLRLSWGWLGNIPGQLRAAFLGCGVSIVTLAVLLPGQVDLFVLGGLAGCYALLRSGRPFTAGSVLALALCKPHLAAAVVLLLIMKGQWRALAGLAAVGVPLLIGPTLLFGPHLVADQAHLLFSYAGTANDYRVNASMMINFRGAVTSLTGSSSVWLWLPLQALVAGVAFYVAVRIWRSRPPLHAQSWALAFVLPLLYSPHAHMQTIVLLIAAAGLYLADSQATGRPAIGVEHALVALVAVIALWLLNAAGVALVAFLVMGAYARFARRWPEPVAQPAALPERPALARAS